MVTPRNSSRHGGLHRQSRRVPRLEPYSPNLLEARSSFPNRHMTAQERSDPPPRPASFTRSPAYPTRPLPTPQRNLHCGADTVAAQNLACNQVEDVASKIGPTTFYSVNQVGGQDHSQIFRAGLPLNPQKIGADGAGHSKRAGLNADASGLLLNFDTSNPNISLPDQIRNANSMPSYHAIQGSSTMAVGRSTTTFQPRTLQNVQQSSFQALQQPPHEPKNQRPQQLHQLSLHRLPNQGSSMSPECLNTAGQSRGSATNRTEFPALFFEDQDPEPNIGENNSSSSHNQNLAHRLSFRSHSNPPCAQPKFYNGVRSRAGPSSAEGHTHLIPMNANKIVGARSACAIARSCDTVLKPEKMYQPKASISYADAVKHLTGKPGSVEYPVRSQKPAAQDTPLKSWGTSASGKGTGIQESRVGKLSTNLQKTESWKNLPPVYKHLSASKTTHSLSDKNRAIAFLSSSPHAAKDNPPKTFGTQAPLKGKAPEEITAVKTINTFLDSKWPGNPSPGYNNSAFMRKSYSFSDSKQVIASPTLPIGMSTGTSQLSGNQLLASPDPKLPHRKPPTVNELYASTHSHNKPSGSPELSLYRLKTEVSDKIQRSKISAQKRRNEFLPQTFAVLPDTYHDPMVIQPAEVSLRTGNVSARNENTLLPRACAPRYGKSSATDYTKDKTKNVSENIASGNSQFNALSKCGQCKGPSNAHMPHCAPRKAKVRLQVDPAENAIMTSLNRKQGNDLSRSVSNCNDAVEPHLKRFKGITPIPTTPLQLFVLGDVNDPDMLAEVTALSKSSLAVYLNVQLFSTEEIAQDIVLGDVVVSKVVYVRNGGQEGVRARMIYEAGVLSKKLWVEHAIRPSQSSFLLTCPRVVLLHSHKIFKGLEGCNRVDVLAPRYDLERYARELIDKAHWHPAPQ